MSLEVSSHALDQGRVDGVRFETAVFTNLTRDHLDYHGTLEAYGAAKARLFGMPGLGRAVINVRDEFGRQLADSLDPSVERVLFSTSNDIWAPGDCGWIRVPELRATTAGLTLHVESSAGAGTLRSPLVGEFNAENLLAVLGVLLGWRIPLQQALVALATCVAPPGRMESFGGGAQPLALVDYAHSPDALGKLLDAARAHVKGRVFCVFGCGGDRDPGKRPMMGAIAEDRADVVVVTDDNPRTEDPQAIIQQILSGMRQPEAAHVVVRSRRGDSFRARGGRRGRRGGDRGQRPRGLPDRRWRGPAVQRSSRRARLAGSGSMIRDLAGFARVAGGSLQGENAAFGTVASDSRTLEPGALFVALAGENFDGHEFVAQAAARGAAGAVVTRPVAAAVAQVVVPDTLGALTRFANAWRRDFPARWSASPAATARPRSRR